MCGMDYEVKNDAMTVDVTQVDNIVIRALTMVVPGFVPTREVVQIEFDVIKAVMMVVHGLFLATENS